MTHPRIPLKIGILGAARIAPRAIIIPAQATEHIIHGVASRDRARGEAFAERYGVAKVYDSYQEIIDDPEITAIYNALPNTGHVPWNIKAMEAGKHVLSEKPAASNSDEASEFEKFVSGQEKVYMEAFHYYYHPVMQRTLEILKSGEIGELVGIKTALYWTGPESDDIRLQYELAGGCLMDIGCYAVHSQRMVSLALFGEEPKVVNGKARLHKPNVDEAFEVTLQFANGVKGIADSDFHTDRITPPQLILGSKGSIENYSFVHPTWDNRLVVKVGSSERTENLGSITSFTYQLQAFADAIDFKKPYATNAADSTANMRIIDAAYRAAGLDIRPAVKLAGGG